VPSRCPACGGTRIRFIGIGTQKVEQQIAEHFPKSRVVRWDKDTSSVGGASADQMLQRFVNRQADVLIGTQMIAKSLDLPLVTLVGVVLADVGLFLPDFRASERVFNLLEQVAGRAGRGLLPGQVIVQTYNPDAPAVQFAAKHNVQGFVQYELAQRRQLNLPPFTRLVRFEVAHEKNDEARLECELLARKLRTRVPQRTDVIGPAQAYFMRKHKQYRWQILVRLQSPLTPQDLLKNLEIPRGCVVDVDPISVL
jgi:primosomal protein N' (replication factor Y)